MAEMFSMGAVAETVSAPNGAHMGSVPIGAEAGSVLVQGSNFAPTGTRKIKCNGMNGTHGGGGMSWAAGLATLGASAAADTGFRY